MKAKELLAALKLFSKAELELSVYSLCDHGQQPEYSQSPSIIYFESDPDEGYTSDEEEAEENGWTNKAILL